MLQTYSVLKSDLLYDYLRIYFLPIFPSGTIAVLSKAFLKALVT